MSDTNPSQVPAADQPASGEGDPVVTQPPPPAAPAQAPMPPAAPGQGSVGQIRATGTCILLAIVTLGIYTLVWWFKTHDEMKRHSGTGLGGPIALVLAFFIGIVMPFITSNEVAGLYRRAGRSEPVTAMTGLWYFPGMFIIVGPIIWFVKTNAALNDYWRSQGATD